MKDGRRKSGSNIIPEGPKERRNEGSAEVDENEQNILLLEGDMRRVRVIIQANT